MHTLEGHEGKRDNTLTFSQDTLLLASAQGDRTICIWDVNSGECLHTLRGHDTRVSSLVFSHDSTARLASLSYNGTVKLWSASSGACLQTIDTGIIDELYFNPDCTSLSTDRCSFVIQSAETSCSGNIAVSEEPTYTGASLSANGIWIGYAGDYTLWVPSEYRPECSSVRGSTICIGTGSGKVWFCSIDRAASV
jgi:WD40 repeat protein